MRRVLGVACGLVALACADSSPSSPEQFISLASVLGDGVSANNSSLAPPIVFNTTMLSELESPACASESKGNAHISVAGDGTIHSNVHINNKGDEIVRFGHIHHLNTGATTGPIVWWVSAPTGTNLQLTDRQLRFTEVGDFSATNGHFATHAEALAELLADPGSFYVNFHSNVCPGGFARGFLN
jgi:hypothetical protein